MTKKSVVEAIGVMALAWIMLGVIDQVTGQVHALWSMLLFALILTRTYTVTATVWRRRRRYAAGGSH